MNTTTFAVKSPYSRFETRFVKVPTESLTSNVNENLELIFIYGQNDIQPDTKRQSVSVGDIIEYKGSEYIVKPIGYEKLEGELRTVVETSIKYAKENAKSGIEWHTDYINKMYDILGTESFSYC